MTDEERVFEVLNGKTRIWRFTAEEQGGFLSDIAQTLPATFAQLTDTLGYYEDRGQESIVCDSGDGFVNKLRPMRPSILTGYLAPLANIVYHNRLFPEERYTLENIYVSGERHYMVLRQKRVGWLRWTR